MFLGLKSKDSAEKQENLLLFWADCSKGWVLALYSGSQDLNSTSEYYQILNIARYDDLLPNKHNPMPLKLTLVGCHFYFTVTKIT